jgi:hypothetical protein
MGDVADYILELAKQPSYQLRQDFFYCPEGTLAAKSFDAAIRAVIFAMNRPLLIEWIKAVEYPNPGQTAERQAIEDAVMKFDFSWDQAADPNVWEPGDIYEPVGTAPDGCASHPPAPASRGAARPIAMRAAAAAAGGGWTGPFPAVWRVDPASGSNDPGAPLHRVEIVAEGILDKARLVLSKPWEEGSGYVSAELRVVKTSNFRRIYAEADLDLRDEEVGDYEVSIVNFPGAPLVIWEEGLFTITT